MQMQSNTILMTGGGSGIGYALASQLLAAGNTVIITGRNIGKLEQAKQAYPELITYICDVSSEQERIGLFEIVTREHPEVNVLINNAGIQNYLVYNEKQPWTNIASEIEINLAAPIHLSMLFADYLMQRPHAAIINVTSALAYIPIAAIPVYCATKAALHSYTLSLRHQLSDQPLEVIEVVPPLVHTDLGRPEYNTSGIPASQFAEEVMKGLTNHDLRITYGLSTMAVNASQAERDQFFVQINQTYPS